LKQLRWGLIGCGDIARKRVAPSLRDLPECDLVAVSRRRAELAEAFASEFGARKWYQDWQEMLHDDEIDAIYIASPVRWHAPQAIAAADAGKHVLCEKPMALNVSECDSILAACRANNVKLGVAYYRHFYALIERIKSLIQAGEIGVPVVAQINAFEWFNPTPENPRAWLLDKHEAGGGPMFDFGCHRLEVLMNILGPIAEVTAVNVNAVFKREVEDTAIAILKFERGTSGILTVTHAAHEAQDTLDIFGSKGSVHVPVLNGADLRIRSEGGERVESHPPPTNFHEPLIKDFVAAVLEDREPLVDGHVGRAVAVIEERIYAGN
jgi:predicted dehydrogenase